MIDERGLDELTMRALGAELGVEAMSIYKHVPGKGAVLDGVVELLLAELETSLPASTEWRAHLAEFARRMRALSVAHPSAFPLLSRRSLNAYVVGRAMTEEALRTMLAGGFTHEDAIDALRTIVRFTFGFALSDPRAGLPESGPLPDLVAPLRDEYPLAAAVMEAVADVAGDDHLFEFGLTAVIRGLEPLARA